MERSKTLIDITSPEYLAGLSDRMRLAAFKKEMGRGWIIGIGSLGDQVGFAFSRLPVEKLVNLPGERIVEQLRGLCIYRNDN